MYGNLTLHERSYAEKVYRHLIAKIRLLAKQLDAIPEDIEKLMNSLRHLLLQFFGIPIPSRFLGDRSAFSGDAHPSFA